jgi:hypothetical protein
VDSQKGVEQVESDRLWMVHEILSCLGSFSVMGGNIRFMEAFFRNGLIIQLREVEGQSPGRQRPMRRGTR